MIKRFKLTAKWCILFTRVAENGIFAKLRVSCTLKSMVGPHRFPLYLGLALCVGLFGVFGVSLMPMPVRAASSLSVASTPVMTNDTFLNKQWYLDSIHAREGWNITTGSRNVVVAVIDSGVDIDHPDIKDNLWVNKGEIAGNQKDDDRDGYVDDIHGWNFVKNSPDVRPIRSSSGLDEAWIHGTVVASLIAASGNNNIGISGVAWRAQIMPLVVLGPDGYGNDAEIVDAIHYAVVHGADIINLSLVGYSFDPKLKDAIHEATSLGVLVVSAAGNSGQRLNGENLDKVPGYPACDKGASGRGALTVTALTKRGTKADLANYGTCVDVSAPGEDLFAARPNTNPGNPVHTVAGYTGGLSGTSVAAPLVSGLAVLLKAEHPSWRGPEIAQRIIDTSDSVDALNLAYAGKLGHGRIDVARALAVDQETKKFGPLTLEVSDVGNPPEVRVLDGNGVKISRFVVGAPGDRRGVRATFVRWQGNIEPDIAVTTLNDPTGSWRVYRPDGLLIAAGKVGAGHIKGGLNLAAQDLNANGRDDLFIGERGGSRAWLVSSPSGTVRKLSLFKSDVKDVTALAVTRPEASFFVTSVYGAREIRIVGLGGRTLVEARATAVPHNGAWINRRAARTGGGDVIELTSSTGTLNFVSYANGLHATTDRIAIDYWSEIPNGEPSEPGWRFVEVWPR